MRTRLGVASLSIVFLLAFAGHALASGITNSSEDLRTGWYPAESAITPALVKGSSFNQEWNASVEGQVYAQPLLDGNTLLVATEKNRVYGLDPGSGAQRWSANLGTPWNPSEIGCGDLTPSIGVTATPVIDPATNVAYMTHKTGSGSSVHWYMDALDMASGAEKAGFPVELSGSAQNEPDQTFFAKDELQRPGLLLMNGVVYAAFGSDCDITPFQGWVFGVTEGGIVKARWTSEEANNGGGIWQSGAGLTSDGSGTILISTGNGNTPTAPTPGSEPPGTLSESIVRLRVQGDGTLKATDFFAPFDASTLASWDADFASGGVTGLPSEYFGTAGKPDLAVAVGKDGYVYLLNRDNLGGIGMGPGGSDNVVQRIGPYGGVWSRPGVWPGEGGWVYIPTASNGESASGGSGNLRMYEYGVSGTGSPTLALRGTSSDAFGFSSGAPVITSNGTKPGSAVVWIEWAPNGGGAGAQLRAYAPVPSAKGEPVLLRSFSIGESAKFATPGVGGGRLYVGTRDGHVRAFGSPVATPLSGAPLEFSTTTIGEEPTKTEALKANEPLELTSLSSSSSEFKLGKPSASLPTKLNAGDEIRVPVTFSPSGTGPRAGTLTANTTKGEVQFSMTGNGQAPGPKLEASPTVLSFGGTTPGESVSATATFRNVGGAAVTINGVHAPSVPFTAQGMPKKGDSIAPGKAINVPIAFEPNEVGVFESTILLETSGGNEQVRLTGSAATPGVLSISPEAADFGTVAVGSEAIRSFTVANTGGSAITIFKSKPPTGGEFSAVSSLPEDSTIGPGETLTETVAFQPTTTGPAGGTWLINGQGSSTVHEVLFSGTGVPPTAAPSPPPSLVQQLGSVINFQATPFGAYLTGRALLARSSGVLHVRLHCPARTSSCTGTVALRTLRAVRATPRQRTPVVLTVASGRFRIADGGSTTLDLRLTKGGRTLLARERTLRVQASTVTQEGGAGPAQLVRAVVRLHAAAGLRAH